MDAGQIIKERRELKNISREALSERLGVHVNTYSRIETGERQPDLKELEIICEVLDLNPSLFFKNTGNSYFSNGNNSPGCKWQPYHRKY